MSEARVMTAAGLEEGSVKAFASELRGELIQPGDESYEAARRVYNGMVDKRPGLIARCADTADVIAAVNFARQNGLELAIRGGGHNVAGMGLSDGGLVIDLTRMNSVHVDPQTRTARVQGGCTLGDVDHATHAFGLGIPSGFISSTGIAGLTLGGGFGYLSRKYGLTIDSLLEVDLVLADGRFVTASEQNHPDLFWSVRGGGGNFGVVTSFKFQLHPVDKVIGGPTLWSMDQAKEVMQWYREFILQAPEELNGFFALMTVPPAPPFPEELHMKKMCGVVWCYCGPAEAAEEIFKPVQKMGPPALYGVHEMPYPMLQSAFDGLYPAGLQWFWRADFVNELSDEAIERHIQYGLQSPSVHSTMHLYPIDGAVHRVGRNDTPFSHRQSNWAEIIAGVDPDPHNAERIKQWVIDYWEALHPYSAGGAYVNFLMEEGARRIQATYRDNYERLATNKKKYDPTNLFHINQNIQPSG